MKKRTVLTTLSILGLMVTGAAPAHATGTVTHVIESGDTFSEVADDYGVDLYDLMNANDDKGEYNLPIGGTLVIQQGVEPAPVKHEHKRKAVEESAPVKVERQAKRAVEPETNVSASVWDKVAQCESGGDWSIVSADGRFFGGAQFLKTSWDAMGGQEFAAYPHHASKAEQIIVAERLLEVQGWGAWPACSAKLGLR